MSYTYQMVIANYELLSSEDSQSREKANMFLISIIDKNQVWTIARELIMQNAYPNYQLLGSQILYQKIQRDIEELQSAQLQQLKGFFFLQLSLPHFNMPTIRKLAASLSLVAIYSILDNWQTLLNDVVKFMAGSQNCLQSGLVFLTSLSQELKKNNRIKMGQKMQIKYKLLGQQQLLNTIFQQTLQINNNITHLSLQCIESWINVGFPMLKKQTTIQIIILLIQSKQDLFLESCCRILSQTLKLSAQQKFQLMNNQSDISSQIKRYNEHELSSLKAIIEHCNRYKPIILKAMQSSQGLSDVEIYTLIIKEMLLSFEFLLLEDVGYQLIQIMVIALKSKSLKLSYSTFQFWLDFIEKLGKSKIQEVYQQKFIQIVDLTLNIVLQKIKVNQSFLFEMLKQDDTIDDLDDISFSQYRKEAQYFIKNSYQFFILKKEKEGSTRFFRKLIASIETDFHKQYLGIGTQLAIFSIKSIQQSLIKPYDTQNLLDCIQYMMKYIESKPHLPLPPKLIAGILQLIKNCNRQIRSRDNLFLSSLSFTLKYVQTQDLCHYAVYAFQSLMQSIQSISNPGLINDLLTFYNSITFTKQAILQKILQGILTSITKLQDQQLIYNYLQIIMNGILNKNNNLLMSNNDSIQDNSLILIQINIFLDCYEHIQEINQQKFNLFFLNIADQGILMITKLISSYINNNIQFSNVNQLGLSLTLCRNALKICSNVNINIIPIDNYIKLMNLILHIFQDNNNITLFLKFSNLIEIINKILSQFMNKNILQINNWLLLNLQNISLFFFKYMQQKINKINSIDPDIMKYYFSLEQSVLIYNKEIFINQNKIVDILNLALFSIKFLNQKQMQRRIISFLHLAIQNHLFSSSYQNIFKCIFSSIPIINSICYINVAKIFILILDQTDLKNKENICRQMLEGEPYLQIDQNLKQIIAKFMAFAMQSKVQRYLKGVLTDISQIQKKQVNKQMVLHLQMRFSTWKRQYKKNSINKVIQTPDTDIIE